MLVLENDWIKAEVRPNKKTHVRWQQYSYVVFAPKCTCQRLMVLGSRVRRDCHDLYFFPSPISIPSWAGSKSRLFSRRNGIGTGIPVKNGIGTMESRVNTLMGFKSGWIVSTENGNGIENPEKIFCRDQDRDGFLSSERQSGLGWKNPVPPDPIGKWSKVYSADVYRMKYFDSVP